MSFLLCHCYYLYFLPTIEWYHNYRWPRRYPCSFFIRIKRAHDFKYTFIHELAANVLVYQDIIFEAVARHITTPVRPVSFSIRPNRIRGACEQYGMLFGPVFWYINRSEQLDSIANRCTYFFFDVVIYKSG